MRKLHPGIEAWAGNANLFDLPKTAFLCSRSVPASAVLKAYDWAAQMRKEGRCVIGGFHSVIEQDVLRLLLRGEQPVVIALARGMKQQWSEEVKAALDSGRLLVVTLFPESVKRPTAETALLRNRLMCELAEEMVVGHARAGGLLEVLVGEFKGRRKVVFL
jgi:predicted Rossmann fold nucleotide-binding protein DprA/Smf involved in DNA uptake